MIGARALFIALAAQIALATPALAQVEAPDAHNATPATATATAQETGHGPVAQGGDAVEGPVDIITPHITDSHIMDVPCWNHGTLMCEVELPTWKPVMIGGYALDLSPTKHVVMLLFAAFLCCAVLITAARAHARHSHAIGRPKGFAAGIESMVLYIRQEVAIPNLGHHGEKYAPFILTLFFFIMFANLLGLIPYGSTATGNISVTATLAIVTFIVVEIAGMRALGAGYLNTVFYWNKDLPLYMRIPLFLIMTPIEIIGKFTKPFALTIRLFANMTAGHIVVLALIGLIFLFHNPFSVAPFFMAVLIMILELFVALLQAFIFSLLAAVFIGQIRESAH
ncbi:MAG TPA: F0F1 ATP synthase subunit A [Gemmatimonadaceae bacterium]|nr:F0F1 ATP synthase subunit A [Gemmatimonadaceae bacterium]